MVGGKLLTDPSKQPEVGRLTNELVCAIVRRRTNLDSGLATAALIALSPDPSPDRMESGLTC